MACRTVERDSRAVYTELAQCDAIAPGWSDAGREGAGPRAMGAVCRHAEPAHGAGAAVQERDRGRCNAVDSVGSGLRQPQRIAGAADRKSVVKGKRGTVRGDPGGRRIIKKKK